VLCYDRRQFECLVSIAYITMNVITFTLSSALSSLFSLRLLAIDHTTHNKFQWGSAVDGESGDDENAVGEEESIVCLLLAASIPCAIFNHWFNNERR